MLDRALVDSLFAVVSEANQPQGVAKRLIAWLTRMSQEELPLGDHERFLVEVCNVLSMAEKHED